MVSNKLLFTVEIVLSAAFATEIVLSAVNQQFTTEIVFSAANQCSLLKL
jgi:hypothetical protein